MSLACLNSIVVYHPMYISYDREEVVSLHILLFFLFVRRKAVLFFFIKVRRSLSSRGKEIKASDWYYSPVLQHISIIDFPRLLEFLPFTGGRVAVEAKLCLEPFLISGA